jgi:hypothetical protein
MRFKAASDIRPAMFILAESAERNSSFGGVFDLCRAL